MGQHEHLKSGRTKSKSRMLAVLAIICTFMVIEIVTAVLSHSLALMADAGHMLTDVGALLLGLTAIWFAGKPATAEKTYGYYRSEILAGFINALALVGISLFIIVEASERLKNPPEVAAVPIFCVALLGLIVNFVSLRLLSDSKAESINTRAAYLEILGDSMVSGGVMVSSIIVYFTHWYAADPIISGLIGLIILPRTWLLLSECTNILMEGTPGHIDLSELRRAMLGVEGVIEVHDVHVWTITSGLDSMSGHVRIDPKAQAEVVLDAVTKVLKDEFELHHTTIQVEQAACESETDVCVAIESVKSGGLPLPKN
jgi:cobalt-zinc-cadmium efflux system protein